MMSCAKNTLETGGIFGSDCIYFLPPKMFSHGCPIVTVAGWSCPWWWYYWPRHCGNRGKASGRWSAGGLNPSPRNGWWSQNHMRSGFEIPMVEISRWYLGWTYTYHAHILLGRLFFSLKRWNTKPRAHPGLNLCVGACFFHFQAVIVSLLPALFQGWFTTKTCFFFTSPNLKKTHHTKTRVKRYEPLFMATNALFLRGTLGWVGWPDMNHLNHHLPIILAMLGIHLTIAMSHLLRTSSGSWWKLSSHDVLWQGVTRGPSRQWGMTGQLVAGGVFFLAKLMGNRWK